MYDLATPRISDLKNVIDRAGRRVNPRGLETHEVCGLTAWWPLQTYPARVGMSRKLAAVEAFMMIAGIFDFDAIKAAVPLAEPEMFGKQAQYGPLIRDQLPALVGLLKKDPSTRRAVLYFGKPTTALGPDSPCTVSLQFIVREGFLDLFLTMRSWDLAYGLPTDVAAFSAVGAVVARFLRVAPGSLHAFAGSLHYYLSKEHLLKDQDVAIRGFDTPDLGGYSSWAAVRTDALLKHQEAWKWLQL